jgi:hypothetical protein
VVRLEAGMSEERQREYLNLANELSREERREIVVRNKAETDIQKSQAKQKAIMLQLKALRYESAHEGID